MLPRKPYSNYYLLCEISSYNRLLLLKLPTPKRCAELCKLNDAGNKQGIEAVSLLTAACICSRRPLLSGSRSQKIHFTVS